MYAEELRESGIEAFKSADFDRAVRNLESATMENPSDFRAFTYLGAAYVQQRRYNVAIGALKHACELQPDVPKLHYNLGQAYEAAGVPAEAWFEYKRTLELDPLYNRARTALVELSARMQAMREQMLELRN